MKEIVMYCQKISVWEQALNNAYTILSVQFRWNENLFFSSFKLIITYMEMAVMSSKEILLFSFCVESSNFGLVSLESLIDKCLLCM